MRSGEDEIHEKVRVNESFNIELFGHDIVQCGWYRTMALWYKAAERGRRGASACAPWPVTGWQPRAERGGR